MEDDLYIPCGFVNGVVTAEITLDQFDSIDEGAQVLSLTCRKIIKDANLMALIQKMADQIVTHKSSASGYETVHFGSKYLGNQKFSLSHRNRAQVSLSGGFGVTFGCH
jgi:hypothetical protein